MSSIVELSQYPHILDGRFNVRMDKHDPIHLIKMCPTYQNLHDKWFMHPN